MATTIKRNPKATRDDNPIDPLDMRIKLRVAADYLSVSYQTIHKWCVKGIGKHKIKTVTVGDELRTTQRWVDEFVNKTQPEPVKDEVQKMYDAEIERMLKEKGLL